jgi:hypothetical protein
MMFVDEELLQYVKQYLRLELYEENYEEDSLLSSLITAACIYLNNATGNPVEIGNELHRQAVSLLVNHWYENREPMGKAEKLAYSLDAIIFQMQWG